MKLLSMSVKQSLATTLALAGAAVFSVTGVAYAQYGDNTSGQGSSAGQSGQSAGQGSSQKRQDGKPLPYDIVEEPVDTGYVDQQKRNERNRDPGSPGKDSHVPDFPVDKEGKPLKDPMHEQGGPIGPN